jgi:hypothetical protein
VTVCVGQVHSLALYQSAFARFCKWMNFTKKVRNS